MPQPAMPRPMQSNQVSSSDGAVPNNGRNPTNGRLGMVVVSQVAML